jgi:hypothetical protein
MEDPSQSQSQVTSAAPVPAKRSREGWTPLPLDHLPLPTYWPAGLALAITFIFWGLITSWVILVVGIIQFAASLAGWIQDIRHERKHPSHE